MWNTNTIVSKVGEVRLERVAKQLKEFIKKDGFKFSSHKHNKILIVKLSTFLGPIKHKLILEEESDSVLVTEKILAPEKLRHLTYLASGLLIFLPSIVVSLFPSFLRYVILLVSLFVWALLITTINNLDPVKKDFSRRLENTEKAEINGKAFSSLRKQLYLGLSPAFIHFIITLGSEGLIYQIGMSSCLGLLVLHCYLGWELGKSRPSRRERIGLVLIGFRLQVSGLCIPILAVIYSAINIPSYSSLYEVLVAAILWLVPQYALFLWGLILLYRMDEDFLQVPRIRDRSNTNTTNRRVLMGPKFIIITFISEVFFYIGPLVLIVIYAPKIQQTMGLLNRYGISDQTIWVYFLLLFLPFILILTGTFTSIIRKRRAYEALKDQAKATDQRNKTPKESWVKNFFLEKVKKSSNFNNNYVIFSRSNGIECKTVISGFLYREAYLILSEHMIDNFSKEELKAFIYHEIHHLKNDSLTLVLLRYVSQFLLFGNGILTVFVDFSLRENLADIYAAKKVGMENFVKALEKLRQEKVKRKLSGWLTGLNFIQRKKGHRSRSWIEDVYWKIFGNYIPLYSHPSIKDRIRYLKNVS